MKRLLTLLLVLTLAACGGGPSVSDGYVPVIDHTPKPPEKSAPFITVMTGQSNAANGNENAGIGQQFVKRYKADHKGRDVIYIQIAKGGREATAFLDGQEVGQLRRQLYDTTKLPPADVLLAHQGEADRDKPGELWVATWDTVLLQMRNAGVIDEDTPVIFGELARGRAGAMNAHMNGIAKLPGVIGIASSAGIPLNPDGVHFTRDQAGLGEMGNRYYEIFKGHDMKSGRM